MSTQDLRSAFLERDAWEREAELFRIVRVKESWRNNSSLRFDRLGFQFLFLHILPLGRLRTRIEIGDDLVKLGRDHFFAMVPSDARANLDGAVIIGSDTNKTAWIQCFRHGGLELTLYLPQFRVPPENFIDGRSLTNVVQSGVRLADQWLNARRVSPPLAVFLSLWNVNNMPLLDLMNRERRLENSKFDRELVLIPAVIVESASDRAELHFAELSDLLWQSAGWPGAPGA